MAMSLPTTRGQWIAAGIAVAVIVAVLEFRTGTFTGHAVEVSIENAGGNAVFAYIDSGRYGRNIETTKVKTTDSGETPAGLKVHPLTTGSFGHAVGLFDQPTLHVIPLTEGQPADLKLESDSLLSG